MEKKLYRDDYHKKIGGVCAGLAEYFGMDVTLVRVLFLATLILHGSGLVLYIILWACLPKKSYTFNSANPFVDYKVPPTTFGNVPPAGQPAPPFMAMPPKKVSTGGVIVGAVLIIIGGLCLLDNFDFIPDWDFENLWPLIIVAVGLGMILTGSKKQPWEHNNWNNPATDTDKKEEQTNDNPPTV